MTSVSFARIFFSALKKILANEKLNNKKKKRFFGCGAALSVILKIKHFKEPKKELQFRYLYK